jgi:hypothetical protein
MKQKTKQVTDYEATTFFGCNNIQSVPPQECVQQIILQYIKSHIL